MRSKAIDARTLNLENGNSLTIGNRSFDDSKSPGVEVILPLYISKKILTNITEIKKVPPGYKWEQFWQVF